MVSRLHLPKSISHIYLIYISCISHIYLIYISYISHIYGNVEKVGKGFITKALLGVRPHLLGYNQDGENKRRQQQKKAKKQTPSIAGFGFGLFRKNKKKSKTREQGPFEFPLRKFVNSMQIPWFVQLNPTQLATWKWRGCSSKKLVDIF